MRKLVSLLLVLALAFGAAGAMAESLLPWEGDPIVWEGYGLDLGVVENPEAEVLKDYRKTTGNASINWSVAPGSDYNTACSLMLNTGDLPDIIWLSDSKSVAGTYGEMNYFLDFTDYLDYMPNVAKYIEEYPQIARMKTADGSLYSINSVEGTDALSESFYVNKTALDALNLPVPKTWEELLEAMRAFKAANPESSAVITYGWGHDAYMSMFQLINGAQTGFYYDGEKWTHGLVDGTGSYKELVEMMAIMYDEGLLHPEYANLSAEQANQIAMDGAWLIGHYYMNSLENEIFMGDAIPFEFEAMLTPDYSEAKPGLQKLTVQYDGTPSWGYFVNSEVENPELMASYLDNIMSEASYYRAFWGIEGISYDFDEKGTPYYLEDYSTNNDKRTEIGILGYWDNRFMYNNMKIHDYANLTEKEKGTYDMIAKAYADGEKDFFVRKRANPGFTTEQSDTLATLVTPFNTYVGENILLFIDGTRPMDEWDAFVEEALSYTDMDAVLAIYEAGEQTELTDVRRVPQY